MKLPVTRARTSIVARSSFSVRGPKIWNDLPLNAKNCVTLETFKIKLKHTYLLNAMNPNVVSGQYYMSLFNKSVFCVI